MADSLCPRSFFSCKDSTLNVRNQSINQLREDQLELYYSVIRRVDKLATPGGKGPKNHGGVIRKKLKTVYLSRPRVTTLTKSLKLGYDDVYSITCIECAPTCINCKLKFGDKITVSRGCAGVRGGP